MGSELEVAGTVRYAGDLAEVRVPKGSSGPRERNLVPGIQAIHLEDERSNILRQIEIPMQGGIEILVARIPQTERRRAW